MQLNNWIFCTVATVSSLTAAQASAGTFNYWLRAYPSQSPACHEVASSLGERFEATYGVTVSRATCNAPSDGVGVDIKIEYQAEEALNLVSTKPSLSARIEAGWFATQEQCAAALPTEAEHFASATGLTPFLTFCYSDGLARDYPWVPRIDAFGATATPPRYDGTLLFGSPVNHTRASFEASIFGSLADRGIDVRRVTIANVSGYATVTAIYYAPERHQLETGEFGGFEQRAQCDAELAVLSTIYSAEGNNALSLFCATPMIGTAELQGIFVDDLGFDTSASVEAYQSYAACAADRERLLDVYRSVGRNVAGGICSRPSDPSDRRGWIVTLFEE